MGAKLMRLAMVNFMSQLDWAAGVAGIWVSVIERVYVRVFLDESNTEL